MRLRPRPRMNPPLRRYKIDMKRDILLYSAIRRYNKLPDDTRFRAWCLSNDTADWFFMWASFPPEKLCGSLPTRYESGKLWSWPSLPAYQDFAVGRVFKSQVFLCRLFFLPGDHWFARRESRRWYMYVDRPILFDGVSVWMSSLQCDIFYARYIKIKYIAKLPFCFANVGSYVSLV